MPREIVYTQSTVEIYKSIVGMVARPALLFLGKLAQMNVCTYRHCISSKWQLVLTDIKISQNFARTCLRSFGGEISSMGEVQLMRLYMRHSVLPTW
jgi:hypothetical protein